MSDLSYRVIAECDGARFGSVMTTHAPQKLADQLAHETRIVRPDMDGALTVHVWPTRPDEHHRLPVPDNAQRFDYPA